MTRGDLKFIYEMQDKWVNEEAKAIQNVSLIKTYLSVSKVASFLTQER